MPTHFNLVLDTTAPAGATFVINGGTSATPSPAVTGNFATTDPDVTGYQVKVWGDVEGVATEGAAAWVAYDPALPFLLSSGDGTKRISAKIRDDVGNETGTLTDTIRLDSVLPLPVITIDFAPLKISKISGWDVSSGAFSVDSDIQAWEVKVVPATGSLRDAGTTIPMATGSQNTSGGVVDSGTLVLAANDPQSVLITGADLEAASAGDGPKIVKIFAQDVDGYWSVM